MSSLRILVLAAYLPWHGHGGGVLVGNLLRQLKDRHDLTLLTYVDAGEEQHLPEVVDLCRRLVTVPWMRTAVTDGNQSHLPDGAMAASSRWQRAWRRLPTPLRASANALRQLSRQWRDHRSETLPIEVVARQTTPFAAKLEQCLQEHSYDLILAEWPEMALYGMTAPATAVRVLESIELRSVTYRRYVDASPDLNSKLFWFSQWRKMQRLEQQIVQRYDVVTAVSAKDGQRLAGLGGKAEIVVNPIGLDLAGRPQQDMAERRSDTLVFLGRMSYGPNADAVRCFLEYYPEIRAACPDTRFLVVGGSPPADIQALDGHNGITVTGYVPDLDQYLATGTVFVLPMRQGGGIKIKALEGMAAGIPIVATPAGAEGLDHAEDGQHLLIARTAREFVAKTVLMLQDQELRRRIAGNARRLVWERYNSAINVAQLEQYYLEKVQQRRASLPAASNSRKSD